MSESKTEQMYEQMRAYIRSTVELEFLKQKPETRSAPEPKVIEGPPGKDGTSGKDGIDGKDGAPGKDGVNGIATREEIQEIVKREVIELQTRSLADAYVGVFRPGDSYKRGAIAQWEGTPWLALSDTKGTPGLSPEWKLFAKKGKDASRK